MTGLGQKTTPLGNLQHLSQLLSGILKKRELYLETPYLGTEMQRREGLLGRKVVLCFCAIPIACRLAGV